MSKIRCYECDAAVHKYINICGDAWCIDCAEDYLEDELAELKRNNRREWLEKVSDMLGYQIFEVM